MARRVLLNLAYGRPGHTGLYPHGAHGTYLTVCAGLLGRGLIDSSSELTEEGRNLAEFLGGVFLQENRHAPMISAPDFDTLTAAQVRALRILACTNRHHNRATTSVLVAKGILVEDAESGVQFAPGVEALWAEWLRTNAPMRPTDASRAHPFSFSVANQLAAMSGTSKQEPYDEHA